MHAPHGPKLFRGLYISIMGSLKYDDSRSHHVLLEGARESYSDEELDIGKLRLGQTTTVHVLCLIHVMLGFC